MPAPSPGMRVAPQASLPTDGPQTLLALDPPGAVRLGPTNGFDVQLKVDRKSVV